MLGCGALAMALFLGSGSKLGDMRLVSEVYLSQMTPLLWLVGPVERILAILCHASSRTLTLLTVATGRWAFFWYGFLLLSAVDAIAGCLYVTDIIGAINMWWVELMLRPAGTGKHPHREMVPATLAEDYSACVGRMIEDVPDCGCPIRYCGAVKAKPVPSQQWQTIGDPRVTQISRPAKSIALFLESPITPDTTPTSRNKATASR